MKVPTVPSNLDAEQALLGAILINNEAYHRVQTIIDPTTFYEPIHGQIFEAVAKSIAEGIVADPITLRAKLPETLTEEMTMAQYLARLAAEAASVLNAVDYARSLADLATKRALISIADGMAHAACDVRDERSGAEQLEAAEQHLFSLASTGGRRFGFRGFDDAVNSSVEMVAHAYQRADGLSGLSTGLTDLDRLMGGLQNSDLIIMAGRPGMGKSSLAANIGVPLARKFHEGREDGARVGFFSLEMSAEQLATRIISAESGVTSSRLRRGNIHEAEFSQYADAADLIKAIPFYIDDTGGQTISSVASTARRQKRTKGLDLMIVDYLQLLAGTRQENRVQELTEITTKLKSLAKELDIPIIALSQLSRQVEMREDKRPQLSDLRDSGSIEQDADVVLFVYREEYYLKNREPKEHTPEHQVWQDQMRAVANQAEIIIGKQRHGPTGTVPVHFDAALTKFGNLERYRENYGSVLA